jgi:hypothetical protein
MSARRYNPEDSHLRTHRREKSQIVQTLLISVKTLVIFGVLRDL